MSLDSLTLCKDLLDCYDSRDECDLGLEVANTLCQLEMHESVVRVGFIGRQRHQPGGISDAIIEKLSTDEKNLLADLEKISVIDILHETKEQNIEALRQMLLAIANDVRVVVVKLALQIVAMRHLSIYDRNKRQQLALQTRDIQAPLANRLGIAKLKWELEDLALRELEPTTYKLIATSLSEQRDEREDYVDDVVLSLTKHIESEGIKNPRVYGRAKHINSIFNKMKKKNKRLEEIYDLLAIRVQVNSLKDCYTVLGIVHSIWRHIPSEFDDYIANPKPNGYQSLHTAVLGPNERTIEIQIRTNAMHEYAELGVAAHWRYKEEITEKKISSFDLQINWLRALLGESDEAISEEFAAEITEDRVYVVTPQGKVIDLPNGSTPLDFAYHIHTDLGHRTIGARINGNLLPITYHLTTGDTVEILTEKKLNPSRDWLNPHSGYLKSSKSRAKVRYFFKQLERDKAHSEGQIIFEKSLRKLDAKLSTENLEKIVKKYNIKNIDELYTSIGFGDIGILSIERQISALLDEKHIDLNNISARLARIPIRKSTRQKGSIIIEGIDDLLISMASCCHPVSPESIKGFITKTKGIRIHQSSCVNLQAMSNSEPEKIMEVNWADGVTGFPSTIHIDANDRSGLIRDICQVLLNDSATIQKVHFGRNDDDRANMQLQITVKNSEHLSHILEKISHIKTVHSAIRVETTG